MRLSVKQGDPGFSEFACGAKVYLNGGDFLEEIILTGEVAVVPPEGFRR